MPAKPNSIRGIDYPTGRQMNRRTEFVIVQEDPTRRIIFKSNQPGTIDAQQKNLMVPEQADDNTPDSVKWKEVFPYEEVITKYK